MNDNYKKYSSTTIAGSGNQFYFTMSDGERSVGRIYYKLSVGGRHNFSLLFSNTIDTTYSDGSISKANLVCESWELLGARIGICEKADPNVEGEMKPLTFGGDTSKTVLRGEEFWSDPCELDAVKGKYLCFEAEFSGKMIPYHEETILPCFIYKNGSWESGKRIPFPSMIGCDRAVNKRIAFLGDSITQGIGTEVDSYAHWNAVLSEMMSSDNAYWNLGLGFARAEDAATGGVWLTKAKQNDEVFVCLGTNDIMQGKSAEEVISSLDRIVELLSAEGVKIIFQTLPPFDYWGALIERWEKVNDHIMNVIAKKVFDVFDVVPYLCGEERHIAKYGGHPNAEGCRVWAEALFEHLKENSQVR